MKKYLKKLTKVLQGKNIMSNFATHIVRGARYGRRGREQT